MVFLSTPYERPFPVARPRDPHAAFLDFDVASTIRRRRRRWARAGTGCPRPIAIAVDDPSPTRSVAIALALGGLETALQTLRRARPLAIAVASSGVANLHDLHSDRRLTGSLEPADDEAPRLDEEACAGAAGAAEAAPAEGDDAGSDGIMVCCFDNRGVGRSSVPPNKSYYS
ncbi:hypothetical protein C2845_PM05G32160 [Panicum miliaceum]|uniref:Uncharacterized protein n=1 Tax=Panicum miliaceum TaxID=4540 RepID=A0A3L6SYL7_PANMI|nr:hypothetical protein C2845_PM05G32160 [Panicum miliaceum]